MVGRSHPEVGGYDEPDSMELVSPLYGQQCNPVRLEYDRLDNQLAWPIADLVCPCVITTYRLTEHHTISRWLLWLGELQPGMFCEISPELSRKKVLRNGDWARGFHAAC